MVALSASILNIPPKPRLTYRSFQLLFALKTQNNHEIGHYLTLSSGSVNSNAELHSKTRNRIYKADFSLTLLNYLVNCVTTK
jgi:hypothetical protein